MNSRIERGNSQLKKKLSEIISYDLSDPRILDNMVTVTKVSLSSDLKYAKVFVSVYGETNPQEVLSALKRAEGHIKKLLAGKLEFRMMPTFDFVLDTSEDYSEKINKLLKNITYSNQEDENLSD
ncbi:MAG: 30S ribosome-binding factor RbfA [Christensenellales bacterium]